MLLNYIYNIKWHYKFYLIIEWYEICFIAYLHFIYKKLYTQPKISFTVRAVRKFVANIMLHYHMTLSAFSLMKKPPGVDAFYAYPQTRRPSCLRCLNNNAQNGRRWAGNLTCGCIINLNYSSTNDLSFLLVRFGLGNCCYTWTWP